MAKLKVVVDIGPPKREFWLTLERGVKLSAQSLKLKVMQAANLPIELLGKTCDIEVRDSDDPDARLTARIGDGCVIHIITSSKPAPDSFSDLFGKAENPFGDLFKGLFK